MATFSRFIWTAVLLALPVLAHAQQSAVEVGRAEIRSGRMGVVAASMDLTPDQQQVFWPLYREYADAQEALLDRRIAMLQSFVTNYDTMTEKQAREIAQLSFQIQRDRTARRERYFDIMSEQLGPVVAARFIQIIDEALETLLSIS